MPYSPWVTTTPGSGSSCGIHGEPGGETAGYFTLPYVYLLDGNLADDLSTIKLVE